jgi:BNR/Asp-box repeat protein
MRRSLTALAVFLLLLLAGVPVGAAQPLISAPKDFRAYQMAQEFQLARHLQLAARSSGAVHPLTRTLAKAATSILATNVQQISQDTLDGPPGSEDDTQVEPDIAVDPNDPNLITATFQQGRFQDGGSADPGFATSHDGGATWTSGNLPNLTVAVGGEFERASDPVVAFGPDGAVYIQTLGINFTDCRSAVVVQRSEDGGLTFGDPLTIVDDNNCDILHDKNWLTVDTFPGSPHYGRIYAVWDIFTVAPTAPLGSISPIVLKYSDDRGETWSELITVSPDPLSSGIGALPLVQPDGDLTVVWDHFGVDFDEMVSQTSTDGGQTFSSLLFIGDCSCSSPPDMRTGALPSAAVDPVTGFLYASWQSTQFRNDGLNDIVLSRSTDGGASWGLLQRVNPDSRRVSTDHFTPDVAAYGGTVHVNYYARDLKNGVYSRFAEQRYQSSSNNGLTFAKPIRLGPKSFLRYAATVFFNGTKFLGDYIGNAATAGFDHPVWTRSGQYIGQIESAAHHQAAWSATIEP